MNKLDKILHRVIPGVITEEISFSLLGDLKLYMIEPRIINRKFSYPESQAVFSDTPFWALCWASGYALAEYILSNPSAVYGRRIIDFGSGSGIVAIAAAMAGASEAIACDIDPNALVAAKANAKLNNVTITTSDFLYAGMSCDLLTAADVLYNTDNLFMLDMFLDHAPYVLLADSRVNNIKHSLYKKISEVKAPSFPKALSEPDELVSIYAGDRETADYLSGGIRTKKDE